MWYKKRIKSMKIIIKINENVNGLSIDKINNQMYLIIRYLNNSCKVYKLENVEAKNILKSFLHNKNIPMSKNIVTQECGRLYFKHYV
jgi:hypothetical protein